MKHLLLFWFLLWAGIASGQNLKLALPLEQGHSHNDYWRPQPLINALELGFKSVEADVFLKDGALLVAHSKEELVSSKTLQDLYLNPLTAVIKNNRKIYQQSGQLWLYIDFKTEGNSTYEALSDMLKPYKKMLVNPLKQKEKGLVKIILTGNYPREKVIKDPHRLVYLDGKLDDLAKNIPLSIIPAVSGNWKQTFKWVGEGPMPEAETEIVRDLARKALQEGKKIRFWNMPETNRANLENIWHQLLSYNCFLIGTDHLDWLHQTLGKENK